MAQLVRHESTFEDSYFDLQELSRYSCLGVPTLRGYIKQGNFPYYQPRNKILVKKSEFDRWIQDSRREKDKNLDALVDDVMSSLKKSPSERLSGGH